jgi:hypothetical protein
MFSRPSPKYLPVCCHIHTIRHGLSTCTGSHSWHFVMRLTKMVPPVALALLDTMFAELTAGTVLCSMCSIFTAYLWLGLTSCLPATTTHALSLSAVAAPAADMVPVQGDLHRPHQHHQQPCTCTQRPTGQQHPGLCCQEQPQLQQEPCGAGCCCCWWCCLRGAQWQQQGPEGLLSKCSSNCSNHTSGSSSICCFGPCWRQATGEQQQQQ